MNSPPPFGPGLFALLIAFGCAIYYAVRAASRYDESTRRDRKGACTAEAAVSAVDA